MTKRTKMNMTQGEVDHMIAAIVRWVDEEVTVDSRELQELRDIVTDHAKESNRRAAKQARLAKAGAA